MCPSSASNFLINSIVMIFYTLVYILSTVGGFWVQKTLPITSFNIHHHLPRDIKFDIHHLEVIRLLGKLDIEVDDTVVQDAKREMERVGIKEGMQSAINIAAEDNRATSVRIFEANIQGGTRCILKEYLPIGLAFGRREVSTMRKLTSTWNEIMNYRNTNQSVIEELASAEDINEYPIEDVSLYRRMKSWSAYEVPVFPLLLGSLRTDDTVLSGNFLAKWNKRMPRVQSPDIGNLWLIFLWDEASFRNIRRFPPLPQIVEGLDYFRPNQRKIKRWRFIRKIIQRALEAIDYLHRCDYCHNSINSESLWLTTSNQLEINKLYIKLTDLGVCQKFSELGPKVAKEGVAEDLYQLGFVFLELIIASFCEDNLGAQIARSKLAGEEEFTRKILYRVEEMNLSQLKQKEWQRLFEEICSFDFSNLRSFVQSIEPWKASFKLLEQNEGAMWKLIFKLLSRGRLVDDEKKNQPVKVTGKSLLSEYRKQLFFDTHESYIG